ncbi:MAG TPA: ATP-grasp domain-containing protein [Actinophytocola sp.]|uniref:ATP-grasp domain-containing protein n=1 Tax=Actinophytocola sp. TaxID=1872138 RepID=UPI002DB81A45|nr:ATP-grasp domain-containing protein [Actinophytocola sp.]HEU5469192.1 ATP-grasp domain-containing protein [Actinophytocola sp.]
MRHHVLIVGRDKEVPGIIRSVGGPDVLISLICRTSAVDSIPDPESYHRIVAVAHDAAPGDWVAFARTIHRLDPVTAVGTFHELEQHHAARIAAALGLPMHDIETVTAVHDKALMRERLRAAGVDDTPAAIVRDLTEATRFAERHGFPLIAKPVQGAGSTGIARIHSAADLPAALAKAGARSQWSSGEVLLERLLQGPQISVEAISEEREHVVVGSTAKSSSRDHLVELGHVCPAPLDEDTATAVRELVTRTLTALGVTFGVTHTEIVLTPEGPRIIETHVRYAGDRITALVHDVTGVDLRVCSARQALGQRVLDDVRAALRREPSGASAIWFTAPDAPGVLRGIEGIDDAARIEGVVEVVPLLSIGDPTNPMRSTFDRGAYVRALAPTAKEAIDTAATAAAKITFLLANSHRTTDLV